jgi:hypothetical protein
MTLNRRNQINLIGRDSHPNINRDSTSETSLETSIERDVQKYFNKKTKTKTYMYM